LTKPLQIVDFCLVTIYSQLVLNLVFSLLSPCSWNLL